MYSHPHGVRAQRAIFARTAKRMAVRLCVEAAAIVCVCAAALLAVSGVL